MLAGVNANDLEALLEFVYRGEVSVDHSQLPSLLQAAHCLNIQGLAPQTTVQKDDTPTYATSIQLHPIVTQPHQMKTVVDVGGQHYTTDDQLITVQATPVQVQSEIVEEIADHLTEDVTKDVISQFLPQRKRKPRVKRDGAPIATKVQRLDDQLAENTVTVTTTAATIPQQQQQQQQQATENGVSMAQIKQEKTDSNVSGTSNSSQTIKLDAQGNPIIPSEYLILFYTFRFSLAYFLMMFHFNRTKVKVSIGTACNMSHLFSGNQTIS